MKSTKRNAETEAGRSNRNALAVIVLSAGVCGLIAATAALAQDDTATNPVDWHGLQTLGGELLNALDESPVLLPASELAWVGRVVLLGDYQGPDPHLAKAAVELGHTHGIVTEIEGLLCLTRDDRHGDDYEVATGMEGKQAEVFGFVSEENGLRVVRVTLSREAS